MANSSAVRTGNLTRFLQVGIDSQLDHFGKDYVGVGMQLFKTINHEKARFEAVQIAGMGPASILGEGDAIHQLDSIDQNWVFSWPLYHYAKAARVGAVAIQDNLYMDLIPVLAKQVAHALALTKDILQAAVFNGLASTTGPDGVAIASASHPLQAGGTTSNLISAVAFGETSIENMAQAVWALKNDNGQIGDYQPDTLVIPQQYVFEAERVLGNPNRPLTADRDINAVYKMNVVKKVIPWRRLSSSTAHFLITDADKGFEHIKRNGVMTESFKNPRNLDVEIIAHERYAEIIEDFRAVIYNAGA